MKTLVEIYDDEMILNIITTLNLKPDKTVFLYDESQKDRINNPVLHKLLGNQIEYILFNETTLLNILNEMDDVSFDIHGGNNLAITIVSQIANEKDAKLFYPDLNKYLLYSMENGKLSSEKIEMPKLTVREIVGLYGASVRNLPEVLFDDEGRRIVERIVALKRKNNKRWVSFTKMISAANKKHENSKDWYIDEGSYRTFHAYFDELRDIFDIEHKDKNKVRIRLRDNAYLLLVSDTGVAFEYDTYYQMLDSGCFDDVDIRVNIDWNGEPFNHEDPNSELDVMATKNGRLISVSCKSGKYDQQAIYEVKANAVKFGGKSSIAVLATDLNKSHPELVRKGDEIEVFVAEYKTMWNKTFVDNLIKWIKDKGHIM